MELKRCYKKIYDAAIKYKYVLLIILAGVVLMVFPQKINKKETVITADTDIVMNQSINEQLSDVLSCIDGVGEVRVFLTEAKGSETLYQVDENHSASKENSSINTSTVTVTDSQRNQKGLVKQINPATYLGAIIICTGGDDTQVRLNVANAVSKVTGLGVNQISVLKMK